MGKDTSIQWCHHSWNGWLGCTKVSPGCTHCYAEALSKRYGKDIWGPRRMRQRTSEDYWKQPFKWDRAAGRAGERHRVFCASMADVFDQEAPLDWRMDVFDLILKTRNLDWLILTKRIDEAVVFLHTCCADLNLPIWLGTSIEDQKRADARIPSLLKSPDVIRFLSVEPLLEPVDLGNLDGIHWVIVGGESGPDARPMSLEWARDVRDQCVRAGVAFFMKQLGGRGHDKGGALEDIPADLRIREFPAMRAQNA